VNDIRVPAKITKNDRNMKFRFICFKRKRRKRRKRMMETTHEIDEISNN